MRLKSVAEVERGCLQSSKIFPIAFEVRDRFLAGESFIQIASSYLGITSGMVSGHIRRNNIKRLEGELTDQQKQQREAAAKTREEAAEKRKQLTEAMKAAKAKAKVPTTVAVPARSKPKTSKSANILLDMRACECWFPVGETPSEPANQLFCGTRTDGGLWCVEHRQIAYQPPESQRRRRA